MNFSTSKPILEVTDLHIGTQGIPRVPLVSGVSFSLEAGKTLALVGESGSGKSLTALSLLRLLPEPAVTLHKGSIRFEGRELTTLSLKDLNQVRGGSISMIFQEPLSALNPVMTIGHQLLEAVKMHSNLDHRGAWKRVLELLDLVRMPDAARRAHEYPHRLSGGMRQRVLIAMAIAGNPRILIADEPTTALDVTVQADILDTLTELQRNFGLAMLLITHDLGLVADYANNVTVMKDGHQVESGKVEAVLRNPAHSYTRSLMAARPENLPSRGNTAGSLSDKFSRLLARPAALIRKPRTPAIAQSAGPEDKALALARVPEPLLEVDNLVVNHRARGTTVKAVAGVSFALARGETVAIVGESGCGKSTLARAIVGLHSPVSGAIRFEGQEITGGGRRFLAQPRNTLRQRIQMVFQDPLLSLNPRRTIGDILEEPLIVHGVKDSHVRRERVEELLTAVGLSPDVRERLPHEFSGGQRQRVGIARALALGPDVVVCDEPVSALDLPLQAQILQLLSELQARLKLSYVFISHDLSVVRHIADHVLVMYLGEVVESGPVDILWNRAQHPYTRALISAVPGSRLTDPDVTLAARTRTVGDVPSPIDRPSGCGFHTRCPHKQQRCVDVSPQLAATSPSHAVGCHMVQPLPQVAEPAVPA